MKKQEKYLGFEQGPIRPPSEARSLLIRATRNCPWNHCAFCPVYKGAKFSLRPTEHVLKDIDRVYEYLAKIFELVNSRAGLTQAGVSKIAGNLDSHERSAFAAALNWHSGGMESIFIQDANSLVMKPEDLITVLKYLREKFPFIKRITSYARSHTIGRISLENMKAFKEAGLNRIHIGMESGSDNVLKMIKKGATKEIHVKAGKRVIEAGMELSEYVMPGLGGERFSKEHALETADALNRINPHFIRLRSLAVAPGTPLHEMYLKGEFKPLTGIDTAREILLFLENLKGITSFIKSDHILNLFQEIDGKLPEDKEDMLNVIKAFLEMSPENQTLFQVGRRMGVFSCLDDLGNPALAANAGAAITKFDITPENVDEVIYSIMQNFI